MAKGASLHDRSDVWLAFAAALLVAGCAAQGGTVGAVLPPAKLNDPAGAAKIPPAAGGYKLTEDEKKLDCSKITGQMRVRIATMRGDFAGQSGTTTSRTIQNVVAPVFGATVRGSDPIKELQNDRARLEALNARLVEKNCTPLALDAELRGEPPSPAAGKPVKAK